MWLVSLVVFVLGRKRKSSLWSWLGGVPLGLFSVLALAVVGSILYGTYWNSNPANIYRLAFEKEPAPDVTVLQSYNYAFADTGITFLKFKAAPQTIAQLTKSPWRLIPRKDRADALGNIPEEKPTWWNPKISVETQVYLCSNRQKSFASENEILIYDPISRQTHYSFIGID
ncbi:MAG: hypothetical protein KY445_03510 [Armatimonadetes bacterium]|nr:hypothetical protein [Armatimonadota bacterium]